MSLLRRGEGIKGGKGERGQAEKPVKEKNEGKMLDCVCVCAGVRLCSVSNERVTLS